MPKRLGYLSLLPLTVFGNLIFLNSTILEYEKEKDLVKALGNVEVKYQNYFLKADKVSYQKNKEIFIAEGNVFITDFKDVYLHADKVVYYLKNNKIVLFNVKGKLKEGYINSKYAVIEGNLYIFKRICASKCSDYQAEICAKKFVYNSKEGKGTAYSTTIKVEKIPVFYTPYYSFLTKRKSGFLFPLIGFDSYGDFIYRQPYYWAIDRYSDATFTADYRSAGMEGVGIQYRRYFDYKTYLQLDNYLYYDNAYPGKWWEGRDYKRKNRFLLSGYGYRGELKFGWEYPSDKDFYYDIFFANKDEHYKSFAKSYVDYKLEDKNFLLNLRADYFYNLNTENRSEDLARLPDIYFYLKPIEFKKGFYLDLTSELTNFYRYDKSFWRYRIEPKLKFQRIFGTTPVTFYIAPYYVYYSSKRYGNDRNIYGYRITAKGLLYSFDLIRSEKWNLFSTWEWVYRFHPFEEENTPNFDLFDRFSKENLLTLRSLNDLSYKGTQIAEFIFEQPYNFYSGYNLPTDGTPMSGHLLPFKLYYSLNTPEQDIKLYGKIYYDHNLEKVIYHSTGVNWQAIKTLLTKLSLSASYVKSTGYGGKTTSEQYSYGANFKYRRVEISVKNYYDALLEKNTRTTAEVSYVKKCWKLGFYYEREYNRDSENYEWRVMLVFTLFENPLNLYLIGGKE